MMGLNNKEQEKIAMQVNRLEILDCIRVELSRVAVCRRETSVDKATMEAGKEAAEVLWYLTEAYRNMRW